MLYSENDVVRNKERTRRETAVLILGAIPFLIVLIAGFATRTRWVASTGCFLLLGELIFLFDMRVAPLLRYNRFLEDLQEGLSHDTRGVLVRIGEDPVFNEGVYFREIILNIYKDRAEDGERRFLLDTGKEMPAFQVGDYVVIHSHGTYILDISPLEIQNAEA
ncbi:MAG: hypothetical protein IJ242_09360 [Clostridia bacterium]|nr:hypothetical protein [Clostridia bacterium]